MTPEEKREYQREYMRKRRHTDPEFAERDKERVRNRKRERYHTDPEFAERVKEQVRNRYLKLYRTDPKFAKRERERVQARYLKLYHTDPEYTELRRRTSRRNQSVYRQWWADVKEVLGFGKCIACGYYEEGCNIHAHHIIKTDKKFGPATIHSKCPSAERLLLYIKELKKCIPLCTRCHNDIHATKSPKRQARVYAKLITATFPSTSSDSPEGSLPALSGYVELVSSE